MKIVIPTEGKIGLEENVAEHFGRCATYTFLDEKGEILEIVANTSEHMGGIGLPPEIMKQHQADVLLCMGLGQRALVLCEKLGLEVYVFPAEKVREIFEKWKNKELKRAVLADACKEHEG